MKTTLQGVRFEDGSHDRMSADFGPYAFIQITRDCMRAYAPDDEDCVNEIELASLLRNGDWKCSLDNHTYSDVIFYGVPEASPATARPVDEDPEDAVRGEQIPPVIVDTDLF